MMIRELNRVTTALLVAFFLIALSSAFWIVIQADSLLARPDNLRAVMAEQRIRRGTIYDRNGERLAYSDVLKSGDVQRVYPYPEAAGAVGYYSFKYGTAGIESAFDETLRGDPWNTGWQSRIDRMLHRPQRGGDVRSTIDLGAQQAAASALGARGGAVVMVDIPSGRVLAMVSQPGYDPNTLDTDWNTLTANEQTSPLLNRVTAGLYQPGGALQTALLSAILANYPDLETEGGYVLNSEAPGAHNPVPINDLTLGCLAGTPDQPLTLAQAYAFGCPQPFVAALGSTVPPDRMWERFEVLGLLEAPRLAGFETAAGAPPLRLTSPEALAATATGQGDLTVTPLQMLQVVAAVANRGNAVPLHLVDAVRKPASLLWQPVEIPAWRPALLRTDVAAAVRLTMLQAAAENPLVGRARRGDLVLYGHCAQAFAGPDKTPYVWFVGFVDLTEGNTAEALAIVVVIEGESDPGAAADVAGAAFAAAAR